MKVVITGGLGFLGQRLARRILDKGELMGPDGTPHAVESMVLFDHIVPEDARTDWDDRVQIVTGDISDQTTVRGFGRPRRHIGVPSGIGGFRRWREGLRPRHAGQSRRRSPHLRSGQGPGRDAAVGVRELHRRVRWRRHAGPRRRHHQADAADHLRRDQVDLRTFGQRLHAQGLFRWPQRAPAPP